MRPAFPRECNLVIAQYRGALCPDTGGPQPGGTSAVPRSWFDRLDLVDIGFRRIRNRTTALFSLRVLGTVQRASSDLVFCGADHSSGPPGKGGQRRRALQRPTIHPLVFGSACADHAYEPGESV